MVKSFVNFPLFSGLSALCPCVLNCPGKQAAFATMVLLPPILATKLVCVSLSAEDFWQSPRVAAQTSLRVQVTHASELVMQMEQSETKEEQPDKNTQW